MHQSWGLSLELWSQGCSCQPGVALQLTALWTKLVFEGVDLGLKPFSMCVCKDVCFCFWCCFLLILWQLAVVVVALFVIHYRLNTSSHLQRIWFTLSHIYPDVGQFHCVSFSIFQKLIEFSLHTEKWETLSHTLRQLLTYITRQQITDNGWFKNYEMEISYAICHKMPGQFASASICIWGIDVRVRLDCIRCTYMICLVVVVVVDVVIVVQFSPSNRVLWRPAPNWRPEDEARARCCDCNRRPHELHWCDCDCGFCASVRTRMFVWVCVAFLFGVAYRIS